MTVVSVVTGLSVAKGWQANGAVGLSDEGYQLGQEGQRGRMGRQGGAKQSEHYDRSGVTTSSAASWRNRTETAGVAKCAVLTQHNF